MPPILDCGAIIGFGDGQNFESQFGEASEAATRINRNLMTAAKNQPPKLRIDLRNQRALMSSIRSIERRNRRRIATLPRRFPSLNATTSRHDDNLTLRLRGDNGAGLNHWVQGSAPANGAAPSHWVQGSAPASLVEAIRSSIVQFAREGSREMNFFIATGLTCGDNGAGLNHWVQGSAPAGHPC